MTDKITEKWLPNIGFVKMMTDKPIFPF